MDRILITGAGGPGAVNLTRALRMGSPPLHLVGCDASRHYIYLAITDERHHVPRASQTQNYLAALNEICRRERIQLIIPGNSIEAKVLSQHRESLEATVFLPQPHTLDIANSKWESYGIWAAAGLPLPQTHLITSPDHLAEIFAAIGSTPVWVRGAGIPGKGIGVASLPCRTVDHARGWVDYWQGWGAMIASEFLPGENLTWMGLWQNGELIVSQGRKRDAYVIPHVSPSGITGAPAISHTINRIDLNTIGEQATLAIDPAFTGVAFVDLKGTSDNRLCITEINAGRFGTTGAYFYACAGINIPRILVNLALRRDIGDVPRYNPLPSDLFWIRNLDCNPVLVSRAAIEAGDFTDARRFP